MKKYLYIASALILFSISAYSLEAKSDAKDFDVTFESLLNEMASRKVVSEMPDPYFKMLSASSYDRSSKVNNQADGLYVEKKGRDWGKKWFGNRDYNQFIRIETNQGRKEHVLMEDKGAGAIVRWWSIMSAKGTVRIYIDGAKEPVIEMKNTDLVGGTGLVGYPFSFKASDDKTKPHWRGLNLYLPIPYAKSCKVTITGSPYYYQINYRKYADGTKVKSFTMDQLKSADKLLTKVGKQLLAQNIEGKLKSVKKNIAQLKPNQSVSVEVKGSQAISELLVQLNAKDYKQALRSTVVSITFDGKKTVWVPVGALVGIGYSDEKNDTFFVKVDKDSKTLRSLYYMPFQKSAIVTLTNYGNQPVEIKNFQLKYQPNKWTKRSLYFHATWFEESNISTKNKRDMNYITVLGKGRYVGTSITVYNTDKRGPGQTWWGEGDDKVYVDGETFPSIFGTGTEDYFGYAWCRPQRFYLPYVSQPRGEGNKKVGYSNNNRYHMLDSIPFKESIKFDMELWHPFKANMNYAVATFYYANKDATDNSTRKITQVKKPVAITRDDVLNYNK